MEEFNSDDEDLLELEFLSGDIKESVIYIRAHIDYNTLDRKKFGKELMNLLKPFYKSMDIHRFGSRMYSVWEGLAGNLQDEEPFLHYAMRMIRFHGEMKSRQERYTKKCFPIMMNKINKFVMRKQLKKE